MYLVGIAVLVVGLLVSVAIHEFGHMVPAKLFGVKVPEYAIGFGPKLWSTRIGETEYSIRAIPLGGFVRLASMVFPGAPGRKTTRRNGKLTLAEETRLASAEELGPEEQDRAFWRIKPWQKIVVMFSGPFTNLLLSAACISVALMGIGTVEATNTVGSVAECVTSASECQDSDPRTPAKEAGLGEGDTIVSYGGIETPTWQALLDAIAESGTGPVQVVIERDGVRETLVLDPTSMERPVFDEATGAQKIDRDGNPVVERRPYIGISAGYELVRQGPGAVADSLGTLASGTAGIVARLPAEVWRAARSLVTGESRDGGVVSVVGVADLAGDIASVDNSRYVARARIGDLLGLLGSLNMALFLFNLIPLLPLDGGHILGALIEWIRKGRARMRGAPDPGPFDTAKFSGVSYAVAMAFIAMTVLLVVVDFVNPAF